MVTIQKEDIKANNYYVGYWDGGNKVIFKPTDNSLYKCHLLNTNNFFFKYSECCTSSFVKFRLANKNEIDLLNKHLAKHNLLKNNLIEIW
jgi:hypothetical protein